jgi:hypothetical protein
MADRVEFDLARYREMDFDELARFIADSLERRYDPYPAGERPHSQEEFMVVWRLLREKIDAMPDDPPPPVDPSIENRSTEGSVT